MSDELTSVHFYLLKSGTVEPSGQPNPTDQMGLSRVAGCKSHPHLKRYTGFLGDYPDRPASSHHSGKFLEELEHMRLRPREQCFQAVLAAGMPHVFRNKHFFAFGTAPQSFEFLGHRRGREPITVKSVFDSREQIRSPNTFEVFCF